MNYRNFARQVCWFFTFCFLFLTLNFWVGLKEAGAQFFSPEASYKITTVVLRNASQLTSFKTLHRNDQLAVLNKLGVELNDPTVPQEYVFPLLQMLDHYFSHADFLIAPNQDPVFFQEVKTLISNIAPKIATFAQVPSFDSDHRASHKRKSEQSEKSTNKLEVQLAKENPKDKQVEIYTIFNKQERLESTRLGIIVLPVSQLPKDAVYFRNSQGKDARRTFGKKTTDSLFINDPLRLLHQKYSISDQGDYFSFLFVQRPHRDSVYQSARFSGSPGTSFSPLNLLRHEVLSLADWDLMAQKLAGREVKFIIPDEIENVDVTKQNVIPKWIYESYASKIQQPQKWAEMILRNGSPSKNNSIKNSIYYQYQQRLRTIVEVDHEKTDTIINRLNEPLREYMTILHSWRSKDQYLEGQPAEVYFPEGIPEGYRTLALNPEFKIRIEESKDTLDPIEPKQPNPKLNSVRSSAAPIDTPMPDAESLTMAPVQEIPEQKLEDIQQHYKKAHYFIFDFNLDAIPSIIRAHKRFNKYKVSALQAKDFPVEITIIHPETKSNHTSLVPQYIDKKMDQGVLKLAEQIAPSLNLQITEMYQSQIKHILEFDERELTIFIGETVDCGATSTLSKGMKKKDGSVKDPLTQYHLNNLAWITKHIQPDVVISENHTFPPDIKEGIREKLNDKKEYSDKNFYSIRYEEIDHAFYSRENRTRLYLVASKRRLLDGYPDLSKVNTSLPKDTFTSSKSSETLSFIPEVLRLNQELQNQIKNYGADQLSPSQKLLLESILKNYTAILNQSQYGFKAQVIGGKIVLSYGDKNYWLVSDRNPAYGLSHSGVVFFIEKSGEIRLVKKDYIKDHVEPWIQVRFWNSYQNRTCNTITSAESKGVLVWGQKDCKLDPYQVARVHGCSKAYSKIVCENFVSKNNSTYFNLTNAYVGHIYSTGVVSRLLMSILLQHQLLTDAETGTYPTSFGSLQIPTTHEVPSLHQQLLLRATNEGRFSYDPHQKAWVLLDARMQPITPGLVWKELEGKESNDLIDADVKSEKEERTTSVHPVHPVLSELNPEIQREIDELRSGQWKFNGTPIYSHQEDGIQWMLSRRLSHHGGILADEMGLGKTLQSIGYITAVKKAATRANQSLSPIMVIARPMLVFSWTSEFAKFDPNGQIRVKAFTSCNDRDLSTQKILIDQTQENTKADVFLVSHSVISGCVDRFQTLPMDSIILDEAQDIRSIDTKLRQNISLLTSDYRFALTGTPVENTASDLWSIMNFVEPGLLGDHVQFEQDYGSEGSNQDGSKYASLREKIHPYLKRRTKEQVGLLDPSFKIPKKTPEVVRLKLLPHQNYIYQKVKNLTAESFALANLDKNLISAKTVFLSEVCIHPDILRDDIKKVIGHSDESLKSYPSVKIDWILRFANQKFFAEDKKPIRSNPLLIYSRFNHALKKLKYELGREGINSEIINGETGSGLLEILRSFEKRQIQVLLINLKAGVGLNLQTADTVIFLEPWWNPQVERQAEDRVHRIGQKNPVTIYKLIAQDTIESEKVIKRQDIKVKIFKDLLERSDDEDYGELDMDFLYSEESSKDLKELEELVQ